MIPDNFTRMSGALPSINVLAENWPGILSPAGQLDLFTWWPREQKWKHSVHQSNDKGSPASKGGNILHLLMEGVAYMHSVDNLGR